MERYEKIRDIEIKNTSLNHSYITTDDLKCDICGKKTGSVIVLKSKDDGEVRFSCIKDCTTKSLEEMFIKCDDDYLLMCRIDDIQFASKSGE